MCPSDWGTWHLSIENLFLCNDRGDRRIGRPPVSSRALSASLALGLGGHTCAGAPRVPWTAIIDIFWVGHFEMVYCQACGAISSFPQACALLLIRSERWVLFTWRNYESSTVYVQKYFQLKSRPHGIQEGLQKPLPRLQAKILTSEDLFLFKI